jgi:hypothetical protein
MLTDQDLERIAQSHVRAMELHSAAVGPPIQLQLLKLGDLDEPPGSYYGVQVVQPSDGFLLGDGGFFVARKDGTLQEFGSGELVAACQAELGNPWELKVTPAVVRCLLARRAAEASPPVQHRWWQFWK